MSDVFSIIDGRVSNNRALFVERNISLSLKSYESY